MLVQKAALNADVVIDLGAGKGQISEVLARHFKEVWAVEKDSELINVMSTKFQETKNIKIIKSDIMRVKFPEDKTYAIFSNIPFFITADIVKYCTNVTPAPSKIVLFMQHEAATKFAGSPYGSESMQSILLKTRFDISIIHHCKKADFDPTPGVDVVVAEFVLRERPEFTQKQMNPFFDFAAFVIGGWWKDLEECMAKLGGAKTVQLVAKAGFKMHDRVSTMAYTEFVALFRLLYGKSLSSIQKIEGQYKHLLIQQSFLKKQNRTNKRPLPRARQGDPFEKRQYN